VINIAAHLTQTGLLMEKLGLSQRGIDWKRKGDPLDSRRLPVESIICPFH